MVDKQIPERDYEKMMGKIKETEGPKVFLLSKRSEQNEITYADAISFGSITFLMKSDQFVDFYNFDESLKWLSEKLVPRYREGTDFILLTGNVMINTLAITLMMQSFKSINILLYDGRNDKYLSRILTEQHLKVYRKAK